MLFSSKEDFWGKYNDMIRNLTGLDFASCSDEERYTALSRLIASEAQSLRRESSKRCAEENNKKVYYFSMEFLIGKFLENYLINFGVRDIVDGALSDMGSDLETLCAQERDPGLGNGGLGRLAACFIDSMATMGIAGHGNGIRYRYGLFKQEIVDGCQLEKPDNWLASEYPWEERSPENAVVVRFGGEVIRHEENGKFWFTWENGDTVLAMPYDIPVIGYGAKTVNNLRLWSAQACDEKFDMDAFNRGDYSGAFKCRSDVEAITSILYPNDSGDPGKVLRLKQEYLFVAAGLENIIKTYKKEYGADWNRFPDLVAIHTNDTHPALCGPEMLRILIDREGLDWDTAWEVVSKSISYTNHTILPEALEKWPIDMFRALLPRVYTFIEEIDRRYRESFPREKENWQEMLRNTAVLWGGQVRMANLSVICGHSVNGVAGLHTQILKQDVMKELYSLFPHKFSNKTNGVSHRRFLLESNPALSAAITSGIGEGWKKDASELIKLEVLKNDPAFLEKVAEARRANKERLAKYIAAETGVITDPGSIFDVQVKRFHAYKRQLLNVFKVMDLYNLLVEDPAIDICATFIFAGKAAQGYDFAKDVIRLVNSVADVVNNDERMRNRIKVVFIPNFLVSNAQIIYPAADISEQISTAGMEASGTGNMKFMFNGAMTLGTLDGSTVEISELVGRDQIEIFGLRAEEIDVLRRTKGYFAWDEYNNDRQRLGRVVDQLLDGTYAKLSGGFEGVYDSLMRSNDEFFVFRDFRPYLDSWHKIERISRDSKRWNAIALGNTAKAGYFSSDRAIADYARDIWHVENYGS